MDELPKILLTAFATVVTGSMVYVFGQFVTKVIIDPYQEYQKTVGQIAHALVFYADIYSNPGSARPELMDEASRTFRTLAASLAAHNYSVSFRDTCNLPEESKVSAAASALISISNNIHRTSDATPTFEARKKIVESLCLKNVMKV